MRDYLVQRFILNQVFCLKQSFVYLQFNLYDSGKIVNKQRIVYERIPGSRYSAKDLKKSQKTMILINVYKYAH